MSYARSRQPKPDRMRATTVPILPVPTSPTVRPCMSNPSEPIQGKVPLTDPRVCAMDLPVEAQHHRDRVLGHRMRRVRRDACHRQAQVDRFRQVDVVETGRSQRNQPYADGV